MADHVSSHPEPSGLRRLLLPGIVGGLAAFAVTFCLNTYYRQRYAAQLKEITTEASKSVAAIHVCACVSAILGCGDQLEEMEVPRKGTIDQIFKLLPQRSKADAQLRQFATDPWGNPISYRLEKGQITVYSRGPNGQDEDCGGDDIGQKITLSEKESREPAGPKPIP